MTGEPLLPGLQMAPVRPFAGLDRDKLFDPIENARAALRLYTRAWSTWTPWTQPTPNLAALTWPA